MDKEQKEFIKYQIEGAFISGKNIPEHKIEEDFDEIVKGDTYQIEIEDYTTGDDLWNELFEFYCRKYDVEECQVDVNDLDITFEEWNEQQ